VAVLVKKMGDNVVDFVVKIFVSIITSLGYPSMHHDYRELGERDK
jgi:hypothetical protein